jgi:arylsulfatase A-like enzyme
MTGRHPVRVDITDWIPGQKAKRDANHRFLQIEDRNELPLEEQTIAEVLHSAGYQTFFAGKWHLGGEGFLPTDQGFDVNLGGAHYGQPPAGYFAPWKNPWLKERHEGEYLTERLTEESISFLRERDPSRPFLLFLSHYDVHTPIHKDEKHFDHFEEKAKGLDDASPPLKERRGLSRTQQDNAQYASMVSAIDDSMGEIMAALHEQGLEDSTTIIFTSDNGGRSGKGWLYEGGIRVPLIIRSPLITKPGEICEQPVLSTDYFPTMIDLATIEQTAETQIDGMSLVPMLSGITTPQTRSLAWHYPHYHGSEWTPGAAFRSGDWKLIEFYEFGDAELYNLATDPGEQKNLAMENPEKLQELRQTLAEWQQTLKAKMPQQNPDWKP